MFALTDAEASFHSVFRAGHELLGSRAKIHWYYLTARRSLDETQNRVDKRICCGKPSFRAPAIGTIPLSIQLTTECQARSASLRAGRPERRGLGRRRM